MGDTDSIRALAAKWSLAGDQQLLSILQSTHQRIVSKCQEVNSKLAEMVTALDDTSIDLQNVNNKFMALSNSQFIESRVYDDDETSIQTNQEATPSEVVDELSLLKQSLAILDNAHEFAQILDDSDTEDSDVEISVVLKPKDLYAHRPLPHIIGSQSWKNKWHAGLVIEDSDTDSTTSRQDVRELEQYSESEEDVQTDRQPEHTISESGSSFSDRDKELSEPLTPAAIAAELARRLGNPPVNVVEEEYSPPQSITKAVYKPQKPVTSTIFSDEPPPMETYEHSDSQEDDIFAEINKNIPYTSSNRDQSYLADDLFGFGNVPYDKSDSANEKLEKPTSNVVDEPEIPEKQNSPEDCKKVEEDPKKPVGGISLFGSNKGTESIGAAILKRNHKKSTSSENESENDVPETKNTMKTKDAAKNNEIDNKTKAKDIFNSIFTKNERTGQKNETAKPETVKEVKKDLFSDNIFDDIDDIFSSNVKIPTKEANKNAKSIFDDDDDLFSDITEKRKEIKTSEVTKITGISDNTHTSKKSIFDSDDDLFSDVQVITKDNAENDQNAKVATESQFKKDMPSHSKSKENNTKPATGENLSIYKDAPKEPKAPKETNDKPKSKGIFDSDSEEEMQGIEKSATFADPQPKPKNRLQPKTKSIFDSDSDDDLFSDVNMKTSKVPASKKNININADVKKDVFNASKATVSKDTIKSNEQTKFFHSPSLFEEEEIDDLFINANKTKVENTETRKDELILINNETAATQDMSESEKNQTEIGVDNKSEEYGSKLPGIVETKPYIFPNSDIVEPKVYKEIDTNKDSPFVEDFIETSQEVIKPIEESNKSDPIEPMEPKLPETNAKDSYHNEKSVGVQNDAIITNPQKQNFSEDTVKVMPTDSYPNEPLFDEPAEEKQDTISKQQNPVSPADIFDDIFREPPAFEKVKETKKATNVNALFEDDSDDEALFFKKNDVISDEKPEIFSSSANFGIFNDEPPALDDDFAPQTKNNEDANIFTSQRKQNILKNNEPDFSTETNNDDAVASAESPKKNKIFEGVQSNIFSSQEKSNVIEHKQPTVLSIAKEMLDSDDDLFNTPKAHEYSKIEKENNPKLEAKDQPDYATKPTEIDTETKRISKLNTTNLNINVQALLPGASPKKSPKKYKDHSTYDSNIKEDSTKTLRNIEAENKNNENVVEKTEVYNAEKTVKVNFDSKPDTGVLDNNISKQRAKIQVKRRPSSRRARHEAVRKSVIDIDDDTDNSSLFDESRIKNREKTDLEKSSEHLNKVMTDKSQLNINKNDAVVDKINKNNDYAKKYTIVSDEINKSVDHLSHAQRTKTNVNSNDEVDSKFNTNDDKIEDANKLLESADSKIQSEDLQKSPQSTTKVVYVLNDEDIFCNKTGTAKSIKNSDKNVVITDKNDLFKADKNDDLFKVDKSNDIFKTDINDDELFKTESDDLFKTKGIITIGKTYKETNKSDSQIKSDSSIDVQVTQKTIKQNTKSLFDLSDDDEELFGKSKNTKKIETKSKLFDSDSEDDLFGGKKERDNKKEVMKERDVRKPLFGDDDDDLFGAKSKGSSESRVATSSKSEAKATKSVFDDPLSMPDDD